MKKSLAICSILVLLLICGAVYAIASQRGSSTGNTYSLIERTDLRRYDNGKYVGLMSREVRSFIINETKERDVSAGEKYFSGHFYVLEKTLRNTQSVRAGIHTSIPAAFIVDAEGSYTMLEDNGFPSFRSFPSFPGKKISVGQKWQAEAWRVVDPINKSMPTKIPMLVEYSCLRKDTYREQDVFVISARWATRYGPAYADAEGDATLLSASGKHSATMYVSEKTLQAILIQDSVDESFTYSDGLTVAFKGTISLFTEYPPSVDHAKVIPALTASPSLKDSFSTEETSAGLKLTIENLQFKPDSAILLESEGGRLDQIAAVLSGLSDSSFLIEGHTASTGNPRAEMTLSQKRAYAVAEELVKRGVPAEKCICTGYGGTRPLSDNTSEAGRAKNRRVEITILE